MGAVPGVRRRRCWSGWRSRRLVYGFTTRLKSEEGVRGAVPARGVPAVPVLRRVLPGRQPRRRWGSGCAKLTPLWHGVNLSRMFCLDNVDWSLAAVNVAVLVGARGRRLVLVGLRAARSGWCTDGRRSTTAAPDRVRPLVAGAGAAAAGLPQLHRLPRRLEAVPDRLPRAGVLPVLDRHRRRRSWSTTFEFNGQQIPYAEFVAPGMLAASAMNGALLDIDVQRLLQAQVRQALRPDAGHAADHRRHRPRRDRLGPAARRHLLRRRSWW